MLLQLFPIWAWICRKVPDLADPGTRLRLTPAAIAAFFSIVEKWGLRNEDAMALLGGTSNGRYFELKKKHKRALSQDELTRISLLVGIFKALNILFNTRLANQWTVAAEFESDVQQCAAAGVADAWRRPRDDRRAAAARCSARRPLTLELRSTGQPRAAVPTLRPLCFPPPSSISGTRIA